MTLQNVVASNVLATMVSVLPSWTPWTVVGYSVLTVRYNQLASEACSRELQLAEFVSCSGRRLLVHSIDVGCALCFFPVMALSRGVNRPQIVKSHRERSTRGLSAWLMGIWSTAGIWLGALNISSRASVPLIVQPECFTVLCCVSWAQCLHYGSVRHVHDVE